MANEAVGVAVHKQKHMCLCLQRHRSLNATTCCAFKWRPRGTHTQAVRHTNRQTDRQ